MAVFLIDLSVLAAFLQKLEYPLEFPAWLPAVLEPVLVPVLEYKYFRIPCLAAWLESQSAAVVTTSSSHSTLL